MRAVLFSIAVTSLLVIIGYIFTPKKDVVNCIINTHQTPEKYTSPGEYHGVYKGDLLVLLPCK